MTARLDFFEFQNALVVALNDHDNNHDFFFALPDYKIAFGLIINKLNFHHRNVELFTTYQLLGCFCPFYTACITYDKIFFKLLFNLLGSSISLSCIHWPDDSQIVNNDHCH